MTATLIRSTDQAKCGHLHSEYWKPAKAHFCVGLFVSFMDLRNNELHKILKIYITLPLNNASATNDTFDLMT